MQLVMWVLSTVHCFPVRVAVSVPVVVFAIKRTASGKGMQSNTRFFNDYTRQLHVSAFTGHL